MKRLLIIFLVSITFSCNNTQSTYKPLSSGRIHSLSVVVDSNEWNSKIGDENELITKLARQIFYRLDKSTSHVE